MKLTHAGRMSYTEAYLHALGYAALFLGSVWAYRAASGLYDRLFGGK